MCKCVLMNHQIHHNHQAAWQCLLKSQLQSYHQLVQEWSSLHSQRQQSSLYCLQCTGNLWSSLHCSSKAAFTTKSPTTNYTHHTLITHFCSPCSHSSGRGGPQQDPTCQAQTRDSMPSVWSAPALGTAAASGPQILAKTFIATILWHAWKPARTRGNWDALSTI